MTEICYSKECCGCTACMQICPRDYIRLDIDSEGFVYPAINKDLCVDCGLCVTVCPVIKQGNKQLPLKAFAVKNGNEEIRMNSSSGGIFTMFSEYVLLEKGVVFGAKFDEKWNVVHDFAETMEGVSAFRGSKYIQSHINWAFRQARDFLNEGRTVLFSGTPCQVAGLKLFLGRNYENLLTIDFVCHGVSSPKVWNRYISEVTRNLLTDKNVTENVIASAHIETINFRNKVLGWSNFSLFMKIAYSDEDSKELLFCESVKENIFMRGFLTNLFLRPSCHKCPSKAFKSSSDVTLADYWGIQRLLPDFNDDKGVSLVMINSEKGSNIFDSLKNKQVAEISYFDSKQYNPFVERSARPHPNRKRFFSKIDHHNQSVISLIATYSKPTQMMKLKKNLRLAIKKAIHPLFN